MNVQPSHNAELVKLRRKFIFTNMLFVVIVLAFVVVGITVINANARISEIYVSVEHRVQTVQVDVGEETTTGSDAAATDAAATGGTDGANTDAATDAAGGPSGVDTAGTTVGDVLSTLGQPLTSGDTTATDSGVSSESTGTSTTSDSSDAVASTESGSSSASSTGADVVGKSGTQGGPVTRESGGDQLVATALYQVDASGTLTEISGDVLDIDDEALSEAVSQAVQGTGADADSIQTDEEGNLVLAEGATCKGHLSDLDLYYCVKQMPNGGYLVAFASGNYINKTLSSLIGGLLIACIVALIAFFIMSIFLSRWALRPVEEAWNQQRQFVADASHELKTPLTVILANMSILGAKRDQTIQSQIRWVESTQAEAQQMQVLVNDMLFLAKSDAEGVQTVGFERVDFSDAVENESLQFEAVAFERGVIIDEDIETGIFVEGERARLQRLLGTLLDNACKYVDQNGSISVSLKRIGRDCRLTVTNSGPVVPEEDLEHLFDRFYRSDKARTRGKGGFGLGLSIAQSIVDDHKGTISVTSDAEHGTSFVVKLPTIS
jgi:two-component system sensor histidine kinase CiaH